MKLSEFKRELRSKAPPRKTEWRKPMPDDSPNCSNCGGTGRREDCADKDVPIRPEPGEKLSFRDCPSCGGSGLKLLGVRKKRGKPRTGILRGVAADLVIIDELADDKTRKPGRASSGIFAESELASVPDLPDDTLDAIALASGTTPKEVAKDLDRYKISLSLPSTTKETIDSLFKTIRKAARK